MSQRQFPVPSARAGNWTREDLARCQVFLSENGGGRVTGAEWNRLCTGFGLPAQSADAGKTYLRDPANSARKLLLALDPDYEGVGIPAAIVSSAEKSLRNKELSDDEVRACAVYLRVPEAAVNSGADDGQVKVAVLLKLQSLRRPESLRRADRRSDATAESKGAVVGPRPAGDINVNATVVDPDKAGVPIAEAVQRVSKVELSTELTSIYKDMQPTALLSAIHETEKTLRFLKQPPDLALKPHMGLDQQAFLQKQAEHSEQQGRKLFINRQRLSVAAAALGETVATSQEAALGAALEASRAALQRLRAADDNAGRDAALGAMDSVLSSFNAIKGVLGELRGAMHGRASFARTDLAEGAMFYDVGKDVVYERERIIHSLAATGAHTPLSKSHITAQCGKIAALVKAKLASKLAAKASARQGGGGGGGGSGGGGGGGGDDGGSGGIVVAQCWKGMHQDMHQDGALTQLSSGAVAQ